MKNIGNEKILNCVKETEEHADIVWVYMNRFIHDLIVRKKRHDDSKMESPELQTFAKYTPKLKETTYNSDKYKQYLKKMKPALEHHYKENRHHPEHFENGIKGMTLIDLIEMISDWKAASERHNNGDIIKSIEINQKRFGYSDDIKQILLNTVQTYLD